MIRCNRALPVVTCVFGLTRALAVFSGRLMAFVVVMFACVPKNNDLFKMNNEKCVDSNRKLPVAFSILPYLDFAKCSEFIT